jgi:hypothetical protein
MTMSIRNFFTRTSSGLNGYVDTTPPTISGVFATPSLLWPPNHKFVDVSISYRVTDNVDPAGSIACALNVSSNEPVDGAGDGDTAPDWQIVDSHHLRLRAERAGTGDGRVYEIAITCSDAHTNASKQTVTVTVPKNKS